MTDSTFHFVLVCIAISIAGLAARCTKPECREGFTPTTAIFVGWYCVPGYDPDPD